MLRGDTNTLLSSSNHPLCFINMNIVCSFCVFDMNGSTYVSQGYLQMNTKVAEHISTSNAVKIMALIKH